MVALLDGIGLELVLGFSESIFESIILFNNIPIVRAEIAAIKISKKSNKINSLKEIRYPERITVVNNWLCGYERR